MSKIEGIVMSVNEKYANLLTPYGEFVRVKYKGRVPGIGEKFKGNRAFNFKINKIAAAACVLLALFAGGGAKAYYSPVASVVVGTNPQIELKVNFLNRIISYKSLNSDGNKLLSQITLNNKNVNDALQTIIDKSKEDKFIDINHGEKANISIYINGKSIDISKFKSSAAISNLNIKIESNGNIILNKSSDMDSNKNVNDNNTINKGSSLNNKNDEKRSNSNYEDGNQDKSNSTGDNNSNINKNSSEGKSNLKQSQNSNVNNNKESQNYKRQVNKSDSKGNPKKEN